MAMFVCIACSIAYHFRIHCIEIEIECFRRSKQWNFRRINKETTIDIHWWRYDRMFVCATVSVCVFVCQCTIMIMFMWRLMPMYLCLCLCLCLCAYARVSVCAFLRNVSNEKREKWRYIHGANYILNHHHLPILLTISFSFSLITFRMRKSDITA